MLTMGARRVVLVGGVGVVWWVKHEAMMSHGEKMREVTMMMARMAEVEVAHLQVVLAVALEVHSSVALLLSEYQSKRGVLRNQRLPLLLRKPERPLLHRRGVMVRFRGSIAVAESLMDWSFAHALKGN